jgi:hypothetical protein
MYKLQCVNESRAPERRNQPRSSALFLLLLPICIVGVVLLAKGLYPVDLPLTKDPDFIDTVFDNRGVLWTARLLLISAAVVLAFGGFFIVVSIGTRMKNNEWLRRAGPFEVSEIAVSEIEEEAEYWLNAVLVGQEEVAELTERLKESDELIERFRTAFASGSSLGRGHA